MRLPVERILTSAAVALAALAGWRWWSATGEMTTSAPQLEWRDAPESAIAGVGTNERIVLSTNPFRFSGSLPVLRYGEVEAPERPVDAPYRPMLVVKAIVGGPPWSALVAGVPGLPGHVILRPGDRSDSLRVLRIDRDSVVIAGPDTTWTLRLSRTRRAP